MKTLTLLMTTLALCAMTLHAAEPAPKPYPLDICLVSGDKLGEMGKPVEIVHEGQQWKFCCKPCIKDFKEEPAKYREELEKKTRK